MSGNNKQLWRVVFACGHQKVVSDKEIHEAPVELFNEHTLHKEKGFFCQDCHNNRPSACKISPFQPVIRATKLTPLDSKRL